MEPNEIQEIAQDAYEKVTEEVVRAVVRQLVVAANWDLHGQIKQMILDRAQEIILSDRDIEIQIRKSISDWLLVKDPSYNHVTKKFEDDQ